MEDGMEAEVPGGILIMYYALGGLGTFFTGVGVLGFVTVYKEINEKKE